MWGTDEGQGVIVWEGRKCHAGWHCHSQYWIHPSALRKLPIYQVARKSRVYLMVTKDGKAEKRQPGRIRHHPQIQRTGGRRKKKTEAAFTIFTPNKTLQRTILIAQVKAMDRRGILHGGRTRRIRLEDTPVLPQGSPGLLCVPGHGSQGATKLIPFSFLHSLRVSYSIGAVTSE